jgi:hypothetical protein
MKKRHLSVGAVVAVVALLGGALFGGAAEAKKKHKPKTCAPAVQTTGPVAIPDRPPGPLAVDGQVAIPLIVGGKACKGKTVANLDVTYQTTGATANAAPDLYFRVTSPDGRTYTITGNGFSGMSIGPVTLTMHTPVQTCFGATPPPPPPCTNQDPDATLNPPYVGVARDTDLPLYIGAPVRGTWVFRAFDAGNLDTSILNFAKLAITAQRPIR